ncbi:MAG: 4-hydroxy-tetrahydrodipicolinate synthase [Actinomycetota bacterium]|jgi:4-hydroxy-tetrahydrodipicolinate synthase|nr:4-hydroxy-tetrahydrodipicolinate synthase [Actinomycetota bacterium]
MSSSGRFGAVLTAMVTPFDDEGRLDLDGAAALARWLVDQGNDGLVVAGTTGESPVLGDAERLDLFRAVIEAVTVPVVAGAGTNDTAHSVEMTKAAEAAGAAGILAVTPYYNRPSQAGIEGHFRAIAGATSLPVMLYDIPIRTGRKVAHDTLIRLLREVDNITAVKDAANDVGGSARLVAEAPSDFELYSGNDDQTLALLAIGAVGTVGVATHWIAGPTGEMLGAFWKGDVDEARRINARLLESYRFETSDEAPNPLPAKAMMRVLGQPAGQCRLPMGPAPAGLEDRARQVLSNLG